MGVDFESLSDVLKHRMRREILSALHERNVVSYMDLMSIVGATNTGKFNYHLKILGDLIEKDQNGKYILTEKGRMAAELLRKFPEKKTLQASLHAADAVLIGFAGAVLTIVNPMLLGSSLVVLLRLEATVPFFVVLAFLGFLYALIVPGAAMWLLTVRRTHSHDMYDLLKPPFAAFILLLVLLVSMLLLKINLTVTISSPVSPGPDGSSSQSIMQTSLQVFLVLGMVFSFLGVTIVEAASKIQKGKAS